MNDLARLTDQWKRTKAALEATQAAHLQSEIDLFNAVKDTLPNKGTTTLETGIKIVTGYTEKWDQDRLDKIHESWEGPLKFPFKGEWKADGKSISYIRDNAPDIYRTLSEALTLTEKKPTFSIKEKEKE